MDDRNSKSNEIKRSFEEKCCFACLAGEAGNNEENKLEENLLLCRTASFSHSSVAFMYCLSRDLMYVIVTHSQTEILTCHFYFFATQSCDYTPKIVLKLL
jgi:hypothetical protein